MSEKLIQLKDWVGQIPGFTRCVILASLPLSVLSIFTEEVGWFLNYPLETVEHFQSTVYSVYRLVTTALVMPFTFNVLITQFLTCILLFAYAASQAEKRLGTVRFACYLIVNSTFQTALLTNIAYCVLMYFFSVLYRGALNASSYGLWAVVMIELWILYMKDYNATVHAFGLPFEMKSVFAFIGLSALAAIAVRLWVWILLIGSGVGYLCKSDLDTKGYLDLLILSKDKAEEYEDKPYVTWISRLGQVVLASEAVEVLPLPSSTVPAS